MGIAGIAIDKMSITMIRNGKWNLNLFISVLDDTAAAGFITPERQAGLSYRLVVVDPTDRF